MSRTNTENALEHADYLADSAMSMLTALEYRDTLKHRLDEDMPVEPADVENADSELTDRYRGLLRSIHEYRKRRERQKSGAQRPPPSGQYPNDDLAPFRAHYRQQHPAADRRPATTNSAGRRVGKVMRYDHSDERVVTRADSFGGTKDAESTSDPVKTAEIEREMHRLKATLESCQDVAQELAVRLTPVLREEMTGRDASDEDMPATELGQSIRQSAYSASRLHERLCSVLCRLEV